MHLNDKRYEALKYIEWGDTLFGACEYNRAIKEYSQAIELAPEEAISYYKRAQSYQRSGEHRSAIADFDLAIQCSLNYGLAFLGRANSKKLF